MLRRKTIDYLNQHLASMIMALYIFNKNLPGLVQEGNYLVLSHIKDKVFANMRSKAGTGVIVPLFAHMIDPDEVPLFPQSPVVEQGSIMRKTIDYLNQHLASMIVALVFHEEFSYSAYIYDELCSQIQDVEFGFLLYPRFLQYIFNKNLPALVQEGNYLVLSHINGKVFANMRSKAGTRVIVPLFAHMIDPDEVPLFPQSLVVEQPSSSSPIIHPISSPQRDDHELFSRFSSMSHSELVSYVLNQEVIPNELQKGEKMLINASVQTNFEETQEEVQITDFSDEFFLEP
ncbi:hypothetical protein L1987_46174 [Smallanthus sonchifolius]|uniref:Uncharacterized protein n=1 Tax=Smallanthus sonchifolius TaxID=185202 RepID=A0ACB9FYV1_9ASTR|nr:hypothetical protein L1987_46174 [Smallanthus sonchifolius]